MQAIEISKAGAPEVLRLCQRPVPLAGAGEVLIKVVAFGINRPDVLQRKGAYPPPKGASDLPGLEVAGEIVAGSAADLAAAGLAIGDKVCALVAGGGYAEYVAAPIGQCLPVPAGWSVRDAAGLPETLFTVYSTMVMRAKLQAGERVLIHGGSSGIGVTAIQLAKAMGAWVAVTVGNADKAAACAALGANLCINYNTESFKDCIAAATDGKGVDVILDMVAAPYLADNIASLADDGRMVVIAVQGGVQGTLDMGAVLRRRLTVSGATLRPRSLAFKAEVAAHLRRDVWPMLASGQIKPVVAQVFSATEVVAAHQLMESSRHIGKILVEWQ